MFHSRPPTRLPGTWWTHCSGHSTRVLTSSSPSLLVLWVTLLLVLMWTHPRGRVHPLISQPTEVGLVLVLVLVA